MAGHHYTNTVCHLVYLGVVLLVACVALNVAGALIKRPCWKERTI